MSRELDSPTTYVRDGGTWGTGGGSRFKNFWGRIPQAPHRLAPPELACEPSSPIKNTFRRSCVVVPILWSLVFSLA